VQVETGDGHVPAKLVLTPIFRYSDQPRRIVDATLWAWIHEGRLVAFQKIEATASNDRPRWTYCFASFSENPLDVRWSAEMKYQTQTAGVGFHRLPDAPAPSEKAFVRTQQMKQLARRFSATIENLPDGGNKEVMRLLPKPVFLYPQRPEVPTLAVFGLTSGGTNPDAYIILQVESDENELHWQYGARRMTTGGVSVKLDQDTVWETKWINATGGAVPKEAWIYFYRDREENP
jgi:hypothetical protein